MAKSLSNREGVGYSAAEALAKYLKTKWQPDGGNSVSTTNQRT